jgi:putative endonuclease
MDRAPSIAARLNQSLKAFFPWKMWLDKFADSPGSRQKIGRAGERHAARFLKKKGHKILYHNFRPPGGGEIDLVTREDHTLVFVEVKTRHKSNFGTPADAVDEEKRRFLWRGAMAWLRMLGNPDIVFRFDIVEVQLDEEDRVHEINHLTDEGDWGQHYQYSPESPSPFEKNGRGFW